jgi:hypothetical protein
MPRPRRVLRLNSRKAYCIPPGRIILQCERARLLGFLPLPFAQAYPGPTAVFIDELNARGLERAANGQIIRRCYRGVTLSEFSTSDRAQAYG